MSKPVSRVLSFNTIIYLAVPSPTRSSDLPTGQSPSGRLMYCPFLVLLQVGFTRTRAVYRRAGELLPRLFTLTKLTLRRLFSVALSLKSPSPDVIRHLCPAELGLSSSYTANCSRQTPGNLCIDTDAIVWLTHILISVFFLKIPAFFTAAYLYGTVQTAGTSISFTNKTLKIV